MNFKQWVSGIENAGRYHKDDLNESSFFGYPTKSLLAAETALLNKRVPSVAYFSMEYGLAPGIYNGFENAKTQTAHVNIKHDLFSNLRNIDYFVPLEVKKRPDLPIYSGGLGVLAGDTVKSAADLGFPMVAVGVLWHQGYFKQNLWFRYGQLSVPVDWAPETFPGLVPLSRRLKIDLIEGTIHLRLWKYYAYSHDKKHVVPVVLLDSNLPENTEKVCMLTAQLYRSDDAWLKILQRVLLGVGGIQALRALGYQVDCYHLNEGHAVFAFVEMVKGMQEEEVQKIRSRFVYTCHTPVVAGHDRFSEKLAAEILTPPYMEVLRAYAIPPNEPNTVNLTYLSLNACTRLNAVSKQHQAVMRMQYPDHLDKIQSVTNGIHHPTWVSDSIARVLDAHPDTLGPWRDRPENLEKVHQLSDNEAFRDGLWEAHQANKRVLCAIFEKWRIREGVLTVAWARRLAGYKRPKMIFHDLKRLVDVAKIAGGLQIFLAGKAHPQDKLGFSFVNDILNRIDELEDHKDLIRVIMLDNFDTYWAKLLATSVDIWLNNPLPPFEASGTSGMKAILNGVLQCTTLDGWIVEADHEKIGRTFGYRPKPGDLGDEGNVRMDEDAPKLYAVLEDLAGMYVRGVPLGPKDPANEWVNTMIRCIGQAHYFNTHRMIKEYRDKIWTAPVSSGKRGLINPKISS